jgi:hypothetical protein
MIDMKIDNDGVRVSDQIGMRRTPPLVGCDAGQTAHRLTPHSLKNMEYPALTFPFLRLPRSAHTHSDASPKPRLHRRGVLHHGSLHYARPAAILSIHRARAGPPAFIALHRAFALPQPSTGCPPVGAGAGSSGVIARA